MERNKKKKKRRDNKRGVQSVGGYTINPNKYKYVTNYVVSDDADYIYVNNKKEIEKGKKYNYKLSYEGDSFTHSYKVNYFKKDIKNEGIYYFSEFYPSHTTLFLYPTIDLESKLLADIRVNCLMEAYLDETHRNLVLILRNLPFDFYNIYKEALTGLPEFKNMFSLDNNRFEVFVIEHKENINLFKSNRFSKFAKESKKKISLVSKLLGNNINEVVNHSPRLINKLSQELDLPYEFIEKQVSLYEGIKFEHEIFKHPEKEEKKGTEEWEF